MNHVDTSNMGIQRESKFRWTYVVVFLFITIDFVSCLVKYETISENFDIVRGCWIFWLCSIFLISPPKIMAY